MRIITEKIIEKISSNGHIALPKKWREMLSLNDNCFIEMQLNEEKEIVIKRKIHPLEIEDNLFENITPFTDKELDEAKESVFPTKSWAKTNNTED